MIEQRCLYLLTGIVSKNKKNMPLMKRSMQNPKFAGYIQADKKINGIFYWLAPGFSSIIFSASSTKISPVNSPSEVRLM